MLSVNSCGLCLAVLPELPIVPTALGLVVAVTGLAVVRIRVNVLVTGCFRGAREPRWPPPPGSASLTYSLGEPRGCCIR